MRSTALEGTHFFVIPAKAGIQLDARLLDVLDEMPACAGVALGVERLLMALLDVEDIADVLAFAFDRA